MRHYQALLLVLLAVIAVELGFIAAKRPMREAQASPVVAPAPALEDPHDTLKREVANILRELAGQKQQLNAIEQQVAKASQNTGMITSNLERVVYRVNDDSKRLLMTCFMVGMHYLSGPVAEQGPKNKLDFCRAGWWKPEAFNNFDIPWGP